MAMGLAPAKIRHRRLKPDPDSHDRFCSVFGVHAGGADNELVTVAGCYSWAFRATVATYLGAFAIIFTGLAVEQRNGLVVGAILMCAGALSALLAVRAARAGVFLTTTGVVCRQLFVSRTIPIPDVRALRMVEFSGFFVAGFLRSVSLLRSDGVQHRVAMVSGRPERIRACVREVNSKLREVSPSGTVTP